MEGASSVGGDGGCGADREKQEEEKETGEYEALWQPRKGGGEGRTENLLSFLLLSFSPPPLLLTPPYK